MTTQPARSDRLSISYLMLLTVGIAVSFYVSSGLEHLRFEADAYYHNAKPISNFDVFGMLVASLYGLSVTTLIFAMRSADLWSSPGKTLALLFATMCLLNWGLEFIAASIMNVRMQTDVALGDVDNRGYILGIWYRRFAVKIGYVASLPVLIWVLYKTKRQGLAWRLAWLGFLLFAFLIIGYIHFGFQDYVSPQLKSWYFEAAIGIPISLLIVAMACSVARRDSLDWWTTMTVIPIVFLWCIGITMRLLA